MKYVYQPYASNYCGAACVASICGTTLEEAHKLVGKRGLTNAKVIREAFEKAGVTMGERLHPKWYEQGKLYLCRVKWDGRHKTHWVVMMNDGNVFDPGWGLNPDWYGGRITSYYEITGAP